MRTSPSNRIRNQSNNNQLIYKNIYKYFAILMVKLHAAVEVINIKNVSACAKFHALLVHSIQLSWRSKFQTSIII